MGNYYSSRKAELYKEAALAQREILGYLQDSGESVDESPFRHCYEFIGQALGLMNAYDEDTKDAEPISEASERGNNIDSLVDEIAKWRDEKDGRCALVICGSREKSGEMRISSLIMGSRQDMKEALRKEYDDPDGIFANRLELAGITTNDN